MIETLIAIILISAITMSGVRRIKLLTEGFAFQSLAIAISCFLLGYIMKESHYYIIGMLTLVTKAIMIPYIIGKSVKNLKINRELDLIIDGVWSFLLSGIAVVVSYGFLQNQYDDFIKSGIVLILVGIILMIGRKKAITQMIGFLTLENGLVLIEISVIKISLIIEAVIMMEVLILALIMGIMIFHINRTFDTVNTDYLSNLKE